MIEKNSGERGVGEMEVLKSLWVNGVPKVGLEDFQQQIEEYGGQVEVEEEKEGGVDVRCLVRVILPENDFNRGIIGIKLDQMTALKVSETDPREQGKEVAAAKEKEGERPKVLWFEGEVYPDSSFGVTDYLHRIKSLGAEGKLVLFQSGEESDDPIHFVIQISCPDLGIETKIMDTLQSEGDITEKKPEHVPERASEVSIEKVLATEPGHEPVQQAAPAPTKKTMPPRESDVERSREAVEAVRKDVNLRRMQKGSPPLPEPGDEVETKEIKEILITLPSHPKTKKRGKIIGLYDSMKGLHRLQGKTGGRGELILIVPKGANIGAIRRDIAKELKMIDKERFENFSCNEEIVEEEKE